MLADAPASAPWVLRLDLTDVRAGRVPAPPRERVRSTSARILLCRDGTPLGFVNVDLHRGELDPEAILAAGAGLVDADLVVEQPPSVATTLSVVVCTRDRPDALRGCLDRLTSVAGDTTEIVVVDNAPTNDATEQVVNEVAERDARIQRVVEPLPGLSRARNRGVAASSGDIVAFTDDDVRVDPDWATGLLRGFARGDRVGLVAGLVASASFDTAAQRIFDAQVRWSSSTTPTVYDLRDGDEHGPLFPYSAGQFGTGASFAVRREVVSQLDGFDAALGAGSRARGGEDLDFFVRVLRADWQLVYEPTAVAWHIHRDNVDELASQMFGYGSGLAAYLTKLMANPSTRGEIMRKLVAGVRHMTATRVGADERLPLKLALAEARGLAYGPFAYWAGRREDRRAARR